MSLLIKCPNCNNLLLIKEVDIKDKMEFRHNDEKKDEDEKIIKCNKLVRLNIKDNKYWLEVI